MENDALGVMKIGDALELAYGAGMDLVEVAPTAKPPTCRVMDYGKHRYQLQKKQALARKNQKIVEVKEVILRPNIDENDFQVKLRNIKRFLSDANKVKITLRFRGRELSHMDIGARVIERIKDIVLEEELAKLDFGPRMEGRQMLMILAPVTGKK